jgi:hypothetical protein
MESKNEYVEKMLKARQSNIDMIKPRKSNTSNTFKTRKKNYISGFKKMFGNEYNRNNPSVKGSTPQSNNSGIQLSTSERRKQEQEQEQKKYFNKLHENARAALKTGTGYTTNTPILGNRSNALYVPLSLQSTQSNRNPLYGRLPSTLNTYAAVVQKNQANPEPTYGKYSKSLRPKMPLPETEYAALNKSALKQPTGTIQPPEETNYSTVVGTEPIPGQILPLPGQNPTRHQQESLLRELIKSHNAMVTRNNNNTRRILKPTEEQTLYALPVVAPLQTVISGGARKRTHKKYKKLQSRKYRK